MTIERNDKLRCEFSGGCIALSPSVEQLPAWFRGRVLYRVTLPHRFINDDHSEGEFVFAGYVFYWRIVECNGLLTLNLYTAEDMPWGYRFGSIHTSAPKATSGYARPTEDCSTGPSVHTATASAS